MAKAFLSTLLANRGVPAEVASAGLLSGGASLPDETRDALSRHGIKGFDLGSFRSTQLTDGQISEADLVLGLAREHVREMIVRVPDSWDRTFTLKELVRRGGAVGPVRRDESLAQWLARVSVERTRGDLLGASNDDDVIDPGGGPPSGFDLTATEIRGLCGALARLLWP